MPDETRPTPPDHIDGEALLEWHRVCDDLAAAGQLAKADRATLTLYCEMWAARHEAQRYLVMHGTVIVWPNNMPGPSPFYKIVIETTKQLHTMLKDMGLTYVTRPKTLAPDEGELKF